VSVRRILFVCSGNICRSPLGEAIFRHLAEEAGCGDRFEVDSAGTHGWHEGEPADPRARKTAERRGVKVTSRARPVESTDFERFDLILAMDRGHLRELRVRCPAPFRDRIRLLREYDDPKAGDLDVPDPYYSGEKAFERVYDLVEACCRRLLADLVT
jgi:low molecular weight protein-tyrosine phosphatase